jgi:branched-chain amino acid transport system ATP-binding protein
MNEEAGLVLTEVSAGYGETVVLEGISLALSPGQTLAVLGPNGVGKTTLLATIMGHTRLHAGGIRFASEEIAELPSYRRARLGIGFVPQEREIFPSLTVEENLTVAERPGQWTTARRLGTGNRRHIARRARSPETRGQACATPRRAARAIGARACPDRAHP